MNIAVFGLGKLGSPMVAVLASKGHEVIGVDVNEGFVDALNHARAPVEEPYLETMLINNRHSISATTDGYEAAKSAELIFIVVPTPSRKDKLFDNKYVIECMGPIGRAIRDCGGHKQVVVVSTVVPRGTKSSMEAEILPALLAAGAPLEQFDLLYNPEFIALGSVIRNMLMPDYILIGGAPDACLKLAHFWAGIVENGAPAHYMSWINAELAKICQNVAVTTKLSLANMIGELCEAFPGADSEDVLRAIGSDGRIGSKYLKAATAFGGPCFPRDVRALCAIARKANVFLALAAATEAINEQQTSRLVRKVLKALKGLPEGTVGICGLAYKPDTPVCDESAGLRLAQALSNSGIDVLAYDPQAKQGAVSVRLVESFEECIRNSAVLVFTIPSVEFYALPKAWLEGREYRPVIIDCWGMFKPERFADLADYETIGKGRASD